MRNVKIQPRKNSIKNPNNKEFVNEVAFNLGVDPSKVTQKQFNDRYRPNKLNEKKGSVRIDRLQKKEDKLVYKGKKAVDEGRERKADRLLGRAAKTEDRKIRISEKKIK